MTLDVLEQPQTEELETQAEEAPDSIPGGTEAAETPDALAAYEAELGITQAAEETHGAQQVQTPKEPSPEVREAAAQLRAKEREQELEQRREAGRLNDFGSRAQRVRSHLTAVAAGQARLDIEGILAEFNSHHAQSIPIAEQRAAKAFNAGLFQAVDDVLPGVSREHKTTADLMKEVVSKARENHVSKKDHETALKAERVAEYKRLSEKPEVLRALLSKLEGSSGGGNGTTSTRSRELSLEESLSLPIAELVKRGA